MKIKYGYLYDEYMRWDRNVAINLNPNSHCHALITGSSGSGKSNAGLWLLANYMKIVESNIYVCDFKAGSEWSFLSGYPRYYAGYNCVEGIREYYNQYKNTKDTDKFHNLLILDEYSALVNYLTMQDKLNKTKLALEVQSMISEILAMGRSRKSGIWMLLQRPDASILVNGARDNFMVSIALGNMSKEHKQMLFSGYDLPKERIYRAGEGLLYADGIGAIEVKYPLLEDLPTWKYHIHRVLMDDFLKDAEGIGERSDSS